MKFNLTDKFILYFVILYIVAATLVGGFSYKSSLNAILNRTYEQLTAVRVIKSRQVEGFFNDRINEFSNLNQDLKENELLDHPIAFKNYMDKFVERNKYFEHYNLIISRNKSLQNSLKLKTKNEFQDSIIINKPFNKYEIFINDIKKIQNDSSFFIYLYSKIIIKNDTFTLSLNIPLYFINKIMKENNPKEGWGKSGESYIVGPDYKMRSESRFTQNSILTTVVKNQSVTDALAGKTGYHKIKDYRNVEVLSSFSKLNINNLNWILLAEIDYYEALIPIKNLQRELLIFGIFITSIVFAGVYFATQRMTLPIKLLNMATKHISQGNYNDKIKVYSHDEIGELTESFNDMIIKLKKNEIELELERKKRFSLVIDAQEKERERVSKELHDGLGQMLIALKFRLEGINSTNPFFDQLDDFKNLLNQTINDLRQISNNLMPDVLREFDFTLAINNLCNQFSNLPNLEINLNSTLSGDVRDKKSKIYMYRIIQESLANAIKHSNAKNISISIDEDTNNYKIIISDDGKGFQLEAALNGNGNGLYNINERVNALNGNITIDSKIDSGTLVQIIIPK